MLPSTTYAARPHTKIQNHKIPLDAIEKATGKRDQVALDGVECLFEIMVLSGGRQPLALPPLVLQPTSGGEVYVPRKDCPSYPASFGIDQYLFVRLTRLGT